MSEATQQPIEPTDELATLRLVNSELLAKSATRKAKIAELEVAAIALQENITNADAALHDALIGIPLRQLAATVSDAPELFLSEFGKHYTIQADKKDGKITILTLDGKPALDKADKPVEFTPHALYKLLASEAVVAGGKNDPRSKTFAVLMRYFGASGAGGGFGVRTARTPATTTPPKRPQFGLR